MKPICLLFSLCLPISALWAGESSLTKTFQPLSGLGAGGIHIVEVTCHDWYSNVSGTTSIGLISARNVPPTNHPQEATSDLNLASACGLKFGAEDLQTAKELTLDATAFKIDPQYNDSREDILRASLECLRRCLPEPLLKTPLMLKTSPTNAEWIRKIVEEFNLSDRKKVFFVPPQ